MEDSGQSSRLPRALAAAIAVAAAVALAAATVWFGALNQDEGWYLYAARQVARGLRPYRDFFFTQGPLLPWVYGMFTPLWSPFGVLGGRVFTALLGLASSLFAALLAAGAGRGRGERGAIAVTAFALLALSPYHAYFTAIPKTYALAALCLVGGMLAIEAALRASRGGCRIRAAAFSALCGFLLACAAATRVSLGAALPVAGCWLLALAARARKNGAPRSVHSLWLAFGAGGVAGLALFFAQPLAESFDAFVFANSFHAARAGGGLIFAAGSLARLARGHIALAGIAVAAAAMLAAAPAEKRRAVFSDGDGTGGGPALWLSCFAAVFAVHILGPFPYDDYQTPVMPLLTAAVSALFWRLAPAPLSGQSRRAADAALFAVVAWALAAAAASPICQEWVSLRQDRFWPVMKSESDLSRLRQIGAMVESETDSDTPLLTQDAYIAVEAGRDLEHGCEMGPFGYFPDLDDDTAAAMHVLNRDGMRRLLADSESRLALVSGYSFAIGAPSMDETSPDEQREMRALLSMRYILSASIADFGQGHTTLEIWRLRDEPVPSSLATPPQSHPRGLSAPPPLRNDAGGGLEFP